MTDTVSSTVNPETDVAASARRGEPGYGAYQILHLAFTVAPLLAGLDKFFHLMVNWDKYLAPWLSRLFGGHGHAFMLAVGCVEIIAALGVAMKPRLFAYVVAAWLCGIIINLLSYSGWYDIVLRDFGLMLGALALGRLAQQYDRS